MFCEMEGFINGQQFKRLYEKKCEPLMRKYNLKKIELDVLFFLSSNENYDTAKDIVNYKCLSKAHVSKAVEQLTDKRYVITKLDCQDRRCVRLSVTAEAEPVLNDMKRLWEQLESCVYRDITNEEKAMFTDIMNKIVANINLIMGEE